MAVSAPREPGQAGVEVAKTGVQVPVERQEFGVKIGEGRVGFEIAPVRVIASAASAKLPYQPMPTAAAMPAPRLEASAVSARMTGRAVMLAMMRHQGSLAEPPPMATKLLIGVPVAAATRLVAKACSKAMPSSKAR